MLMPLATPAAAEGDGRLSRPPRRRERRRAAVAEDPQGRPDDEHRGADRERGDAEDGERDAAEQREPRAGEPRQQVVEAEQLAALPRLGAVGELRGRGDERQVPPRPSPNSAAAVAGTLVIHRRLDTDTAINSSPPASDVVRPMRSMRSPTTITSAYIPTTCAPMIGNTW